MTRRSFLSRSLACLVAMVLAPVRAGRPPRQLNRSWDGQGFWMGADTLEMVGRYLGFPPDLRDWTPKELTQALDCALKGYELLPPPV